MSSGEPAAAGFGFAAVLDFAAVALRPMLASSILRQCSGSGAAAKREGRADFPTWQTRLQSRRSLRLSRYPAVPLSAKRTRE
jgi:hypothetical protein